MKKLLKFAAPILILALLFASCDDRGSAPSSSGLKVTVELPAQNGYPSSGWKAAIVDTSQPKVLGEASSVVFTPTKGTQGFSDYAPNQVVATGFPKGDYPASSYIAVTYVSEFGGTWTGAALLSGLGNDLTATIGSFSNVTPQGTQSIKLGTVFSQTTFPTTADGYALEFVPASGSAINVPVTGVTLSKAATPAATAIKFDADSVKPGTYTANIYYTASGTTYRATASSIAIGPGESSIDATAGAYTAYTTKAVTVTLPANLGDADETATNLAVPVAWNVVNSDGVIMAAGTAQTLTATPASGDPTGYTFTTDPVDSSASDWKVQVSMSYEGIEYTGESAVIATSAATAEVATLTAQIGSGTVTISGSNMPTEKSYYAAFLYEKNGDVIDSSSKTSLPLASFSGGATSTTFSIEGLEVGTTYVIQVTVTPQSGSAMTNLSDPVTATAGSSNDFTVEGFTFAAASTGDEDEPGQKTGTVTISTVSGITASGGSAEYAVTWKDNASGSGSGSYSGSGSMTLSDVPTSDESVTVTVVVTGATSGNGTYTSTVSSISFEEDSATVESATFVQAKANVTVTCSGLDSIAGDAPTVTWGTQDSQYNNSGTYTSKTSISLTDVPVGTTTVYIQVADGGSSSTSKTFKGTATIAWSGLEGTVSQAVSFSDASN